MRRTALLMFATLAIAACAGGTYQRGSGLEIDPDERGETNGRSFDFVSTKPNGAEWTIRFRGTSMWVAYAKGAKADDLGAFNLTDAEAEKLWALVDTVDVPHRREGIPDQDDGNVVLHLRALRGSQHRLYTAYVSRDTDDNDVLDLADYIATLVEKHRKERPAF